MYHSPRTLAVELTGDRAHFVQTVKLVVKHIHGVALDNKTRRRLYAKTVLEILHTLVKKSPPSFDAVWINDLLRSAFQGAMADETFTALLRFSALRKVDEDLETPPGNDHDHTRRSETDPGSPGEPTTRENPALLTKLLQNVKTFGAHKGSWEDDAVYGGLMAIRDIPGLQFCIPEVEFVEVLSKAMEGEQERPFRVRKAAYDVVLAARDGWLRSPDLRRALENLDFPKKLYSVMIESSRSDRQRSFLQMMEILSEDRDWDRYLRKSMDIWLPLHREGPDLVLRILANVGGLIRPKEDGYKTDKTLEKVVEDEWATVPGRKPIDLTRERLEPLTEITMALNMRSFFNKRSKKAVWDAVNKVIPSYEGRREGDGRELGEEVRPIIDPLLRMLSEPIQPSSRRFAYR